MLDRKLSRGRHLEIRQVASMGTAGVEKAVLPSGLSEMLAGRLERRSVAAADLVNVQRVYTGRRVPQVKLHQDAVRRLLKVGFSDAAALCISEACACRRSS